MNFGHINPGSNLKKKIEVGPEVVQPGPELVQPGPEVVQVGPLLVHSNISSTVSREHKKSFFYLHPKVRYLEALFCMPNKLLS